MSLDSCGARTPAGQAPRGMQHGGRPGRHLVDYGGWSYQTAPDPPLMGILGPACRIPLLSGVGLSQNARLDLTLAAGWAGSASREALLPPSAVIAIRQGQAVHEGDQQSIQIASVGR